MPDWPGFALPEPLPLGAPSPWPLSGRPSLGPPACILPAPLCPDWPGPLPLVLPHGLPLAFAGPRPPALPWQVVATLVGIGSAAMSDDLGGAGLTKIEPRNPNHELCELISSAWLYASVSVSNQIHTTLWFVSLVRLDRKQTVIVECTPTWVLLLTKWRQCQSLQCQ